MHPTSRLLFCFLHIDGDVSSHFLVLAAYCHTSHNIVDSPFGAITQNELFLLEIAFTHCILSQQQTIN